MSPPEQVVYHVSGRKPVARAVLACYLRSGELNMKRQRGLVRSAQDVDLGGSTVYFAHKTPLDTRMFKSHSFVPRIFAYSTDKPLSGSNGPSGKIATSLYVQYWPTFCPTVEKDEIELFRVRIGPDNFLRIRVFFPCKFNMFSFPPRGSISVYEPTVSLFTILLGKHLLDSSVDNFAIHI